MKRNFLLSLILLGLTVFVLSGCKKKEPEHYSSNLPVSSIDLQEKIQMPSFELSSAKGDILKSKSLLDKTLLVIFFPGACHNCYSFLMEMEKLQDAFADKGFIIVAIAAGQTASNEFTKLYKKLNISYPLLADRDASLHKKFGKDIIMPLSYLVSNNGQIIKQYLGHPDRKTLTIDIKKMF